MADITMCASVCCPYRKHCRRNPDSGTREAEHRQDYYTGSVEWDGDGCAHYWPIKPVVVVHPQAKGDAPR